MSDHKQILLVLGATAVSVHGEGATVNVDSPYEVATIEKLAADSPETPFNVGIRCNLSQKTGVTSRFGFDVTQPEFDDIVNRLQNIPNCTLQGVHCHCMPPRRSLDEYQDIAEAMLEVTLRLFPDAPPKFYAKAIATPFAETYSGKSGPELILEPGMALVADTMQFVTRVIDIKPSQSTPVALVSGSVYNTLPNKPKRNLSVQRISGPEDDSKVFDCLDIGGYTRMEDDILHTGYQGPLKPGDFLLFDNVGSYSIVLKPPFILPAPPILALEEEEGGIDVLRRAETMDDVFATYTVRNRAKA
jgi:diaminopimelate decarboxylase